MRVCSIWTNTCSLSLPPSSKSVSEKLHTRLVQPRTHGSLTPKLPVGGLYAWKGQDIIISHPASSYLLLKLHSRWVQPRSRPPFFHLFPTHGTGASSWTQLHWEYWGLDAIALACKTSVNTLGEASQEDLRLPPPLYRVLSSSSGSDTHRETHHCSQRQHQNYDSEILPGGEADHKTESSESLPRGNYFICNRVWRSLRLRVLSETVKVVLERCGRRQVDSLEV